MSGGGIEVYLLSGFLGSGKTTLLNRMLKTVPEDMNLLVLMNEFGEEGIDGTLIEDPELDLIEISRGSIFCACVKGDYIKALYQISTVIKPEVLVIEASGVANPADLERDLVNPVFKQAFNKPVNICLVDAENFLDQYEVFLAVEKQITSTDRFIINKIDLAEPQKVEKTKNLILSLNPNAEFVETTYAEVPVEEIFKPAARAAAREEAAGDVQLLSDEQLEEVVDRMLEDQAAQVTPPDKLTSISCRWYNGTVDDFRAIAENVPSDVVRAKGFVYQDGEIYEYSHVGKSHTIKPYGGRAPDRPGLNRVVFIRRGFVMDDIIQMFKDKGLELQG